MAEHIFGQSISRQFFALVNNEHINLPTQTPEIFLFEDEPTLEEAIDGTGAIQSVATWTESSVSPYPRSYAFDPIDDPDPESNDSSLGFWESVRFVATLGQQAQTRLRYFEVERVKALNAVPGTTVADLKTIYPAIINYASDRELEDHISNAERILKLEFKNKKVEWSNLSELGDLLLALAFKAIQLVSESQFESGTESDKMFMRAKLYRDNYDDLVKLIKLPYDIDGDGKPDTETSNNNTSGFVISGK